MISVVKWTKKGFASELPVFANQFDDDENGEMQLEGEHDEYGFDKYDQEDSRSNKRPPDICF